MNMNQEILKAEMNIFKTKTGTGKSIAPWFLTILFLLIALCGCSRKTEDIHSAADLNGRTLIVESGTSFENSIAENGCVASPQYLYGGTTADAVELLLRSKGDALVIDKPVGQTLLYQYPQLRMLDDTFDDSPMGFAMPKGSELKDSVDSAIKMMIASEEMDRLVEKWMGNDPAQKVIEAQTWDGSQGTIRVAVEAGFEPVCYLNENGEPVGLDIDILTQIGRILNKKIEFTVLPSFSMLIPGIEEKLFDIAAGGISISEDRLARVDFSESYYETSAVFLVKDISAAEKSFLTEMKDSFRRTFIDNDRWRDILSGLGVTIVFIIVTGILGVILGNLLFLWYYFGGKAAKAVTTALDKFFLYVPVSTWLFIAFYILFYGRMGNPMMVAGFAMTILFSVEVFLVFKMEVESVDKGQFEAAYTLGYTKYQAYRRLIIPQVASQILADLQEQLVSHVRTTSLVGLISAVDIQMTLDMIRSETNDTVIPILLTTLIYVGLGLAFSALVKAIRIRSDRSNRTPAEIAADIRRGVV